jgi:hypothetical protein
VTKRSSFLVILWLDFMRHNKISVDMVSQTFGLVFAPECKGEFSLECIDTSKNVHLHRLQETMDSVEGLKAECSDVCWCTLIREFPVCFLPCWGRRSARRM